ncbi:DeoR/GlpR family DNA-binding transcription regulator [Peribacillus sp. SCS-155]|uniref:DeoR/GlpR family DNA-binding transcription regulator n=1 Tax=Peribacillus sedimenti TaxID=3115297 RepID=UPI00390646EE
MLTTERHQVIISMLKENGTVKLQDLLDELDASESTIRRDLVQLENMKLLKRVHGGAALLQKKGFELSVREKTNKHLDEKRRVAEAAASFIQKGDCIYLDAGSTVMEMITYLKGKDVTVLTNGITHIPLLAEMGIKTMIVGGQIKASTDAIIGSAAIDFIQQYRFDKCFLGMNGVHFQLGYTTPDPDEALLKKTALKLSTEAFVLVDSTKLNEATFAKVAEIDEAVMITDDNDDSGLELIIKNTKAKVVTA